MIVNNTVIGEYKGPLTKEQQFNSMLFLNDPTIFLNPPRDEELTRGASFFESQLAKM